jgi:hypothetical protein
MIHRSKGSITLSNGAEVSCGDIVSKLSDGKTYTYLLEEYSGQHNVILGSRASYKSIHTILASDDVLEHDAPVEPSLMVGIEEFIHGYSLLSKWDAEKHVCLTDEESTIVNNLLDYVSKVRSNITNKEWQSIYSREATSKAQFLGDN